MALKKAKMIMIAITCVGILLLAMAYATGTKLYGIFSIIVCFAALIFWCIFGKCPHCGSLIGRGPGKYCKHCGKELGL